MSGAQRESSAKVLPTLSGDEIGNAVHNLIGDGPDATMQSRQRAALVRAAAARRTPRAPSRWVWGTAVSALAAVLLWFSTDLGIGPRTNLAFTHENGTQLDQGDWIHTDGQDEVSLESNDGSRIKLSNNSRARLALVETNAARFVLEHGSIDSAIRPKQGINWSFQAGPYRVDVVGTQFSVDWDSEAKHLSVAVTKGQVRVHGANIDEAGAAVSAGQRFEATYEPTLAEARVETTEDRADAKLTDLPLDTPEGDEADDEAEAEVAIDAPQVDEALKPRNGEPRWKRLAKGGEYSAAVTAAQEAGFERLLGSASAYDLLLLGDSARLSGRTGHARQALMAVRKRFPGHQTASLATFGLGRLAADVEHNDPAAAKWFRRFLKEGGQGSLAEGARGRLMSVLLRMGDSAGAKAIARDYLKFHPKGKHSKVARSLVER